LFDIREEQIEDLQPDLESSLVNGVFSWQNKTVLSLDVEKLGLKNIEQLKSSDEANGLLATIDENEAVPLMKNSDNLVSYLVVETGNERYALPMERVCFVEDIAVITNLPKTPPEVVGMTSSHKIPLLVLDLGTLMGQQKQCGKKLVIVQYQDFRCALSVDNLHGIHRLACHDNHEILEKGGELAGYLLGEGERLIGVLNFDMLFSPQRIMSLRRFLVDDNRATSHQEKIATRKLLTFNVGHERCALPLSLVNMVVEYQHVEPLPEGGGQHLHGAVQIHGDILPMVDLRRQMGVLTDITPLTAYIVAGEEGSRWALVVDHIDRVVEIPLGLVNFGELISKSLHFLVSLQTNYFELVLELRLPLLLLFSDVGVLLLLHFELLADLLVLVVVLEDDLVEHVVLLLFIYFFFLT